MQRMGGGSRRSTAVLRSNSELLYVAIDVLDDLNRSSDFLLQGLQGAQNQLSPEFFLFIRRQVGITRWADDAAGGDRAERTDLFRYRNHGADLGDRYLQLFDFFADRCAAASARSSSRSEDHARDASGFKPLRDVLADGGGVFHGGMGAACGMDELVELPDYAVPLQLAHGVERHQTIEIAIGENGVVPGVDGIVFISVERIYSGNGNRREAGRPAGFNVVRIAFGHQAAVGY